MTKHLQRDLDDVKRELLAMGGTVEEATSRAVRSLLERRVDLAEEVIGGDEEIDEREVRIEGDCLKILALHQPVATDLRFVVSVMKVNNDLERMGDLAVNVAERSAYLATHPGIGIRLEFSAMAEKVRSMVRGALDALVALDCDLAREVIGADNEVDAMNREMFEVLQDLMMRDSSSIKRAVHALSVSRHLERIADLATNIAEDVVFLVEGEVIRHQSEDYRN